MISILNQSFRAFFVMMIGFWLICTTPIARAEDAVAGQAEGRGASIVVDFKAAAQTANATLTERLAPRVDQIRATYERAATEIGRAREEYERNPKSDQAWRQFHATAAKSIGDVVNELQGLVREEAKTKAAIGQLKQSFQQAMTLVTEGADNMDKQGKNLTSQTEKLRNELQGLAETYADALSNENAPLPPDVQERVFVTSSLLQMLDAEKGFATDSSQSLTEKMKELRDYQRLLNNLPAQFDAVFTRARGEISLMRMISTHLGDRLLIEQVAREANGLVNVVGNLSATMGQLPMLSKSVTKLPGVPAASADVFNSKAILIQYKRGGDTTHAGHEVSENR